MKKILVFILCVTILCSMVVSVSASSVDVDFIDKEYVDFYGSFYIDDVFTWDASSGVARFPVNSFISNTMGFVGVVVDSREQKIYYMKNVYEDILVYDASTGWVSENYRVVTMDGQHRATVGFMGLMNTYAVPLCDGSTCPLVDADGDDICDNCQNALMRSVGPSFPVSWPAHLPDPPAVFASYTVLMDNGITYLYACTDDLPTRVTITDPNEDGERTLTFQLADSTSYWIQRYALTGNAWAFDSVGGLKSFTFDDTFDLTYSTVDIVDASGNIFFPLPLWAEMGQMTQGEIQGLTQTTVGTITTLTLCGVGLLALLMVLVLFGKRSQIFHL